MVLASILAGPNGICMPVNGLLPRSDEGRQGCAPVQTGTGRTLLQLNHIAMQHTALSVTDTQYTATALAGIQKCGKR